MSKNRKYIDLRAAARYLEISELRIWQLIRTKRIKSRIGKMQEVEVDINELSKLYEKH